MEKLSGMDASFLYLESRSQLMHINGLIIVDPDVDGERQYEFAALRRNLADAVKSLPEFRRRLRDSFLNLDHPVWVEDRRFDIDRHLHRIAVPSPGGDAEVAELCGHLTGQSLDRDKPLWEMWVIEGLKDGKVAVLIRMHHCTVDGVTGANLIARLCSLSTEMNEPDAEMMKKNAGNAPLLQLVADGALTAARRPFRYARVVPEIVGIPFKWVNRALNGQSMPLPFTAPRTSLNGALTPHRSVGFGQADLADVKKVKNAFGVTVNDVVLAMCSGALRAYLDKRGELPDRSLISIVPVAVSPEDSLAVGTNRVTGMFTSLATDIEDPIERLYAIRDSTDASKEHMGDWSAGLPQMVAQFMQSSVISAGLRFYTSLGLADRQPVMHNLLISNVPGPNFPMYFLGSRIEGMYPMGPIF
ncbi:MAG: wax ester/triacylglycerol synthase family O-acyltransferase, partial [Rhodococcus sp. (in: high G+C Gram-positive bacteria)]